MNETMLRYETHAYHFGIDYPSDWEVFEDTNPVVPVYFLSPLEHSDDDFRENLNIAVEHIGALPTLREFFNANLKNLSTALKHFDLVSYSQTTYNNLPCRHLTYTHKVDQLTLHVHSYFFVFEEHGYVISCTATPSSIERFASIFDKMLHSFTQLSTEK